jgi:hypothetical protein
MEFRGGAWLQEIIFSLKNNVFAGSPILSFQNGGMPDRAGGAASREKNQKMRNISYSA